MEIAVKLMDVWRESSSVRIIVRDANDSNKFCMISWKTGESRGPFTGKELFDYLVYGKNRLGIHFRKYFNLNNWGHDNLPGYGAIGPNSLVWSENVSNEKIIKYQTDGTYPN